MIFIHIVFDLVSRLAAAETFDLCLGVGCCWFLLFLAWMGTPILAGGIGVVRFVFFGFAVVFCLVHGQLLS